MMDNDNSFQLYILVFLVVVLIVAAIFIAPYLGWKSHKQEETWATKCEQAGGVPSKYHVLFNRGSQGERICIKKESVIEVKHD